MVQYRYQLRRNRMNNEWSYDEYIEWDRENRFYEWYMYIKEKYVDSVDRDDMEYPPNEYWESGL